MRAALCCFFALAVATSASQHSPLLNTPLNKHATTASSASPRDDEARLTIIHITDVYVLAPFARLRSLILAKKALNPNTIAVLTGDFLAPYLLSSMDKGAGMMRMLALAPIDYVIFGNHEADIDHATLCEHVQNFKGTWLNSNMRDHAAFQWQREHDIVEVRSADGGHLRRVGLCAVLSNDPKLYAADAFGGAFIEDPWEALSRCKRDLEEKGCDLVLPLQHLYEPDDRRTCRDFDFPLILSGHDHHRLDEVISGTRLVKPGTDAHYCAVVDVAWTPSSTKPRVDVQFERLADWPADPAVLEEAVAAYEILEPLVSTQLAWLPRSLSSVGTRSSVTSMSRLLCTWIRNAFLSEGEEVDCVILMGGNFRGGREYEDEFFSLETLKVELGAKEKVAIVEVPGAVLDAGIRVTHLGGPKPGWMQHDDGIVLSPGGGVTLVNGLPIDPERLYRVATKMADLTLSQSPPLREYFEKRVLPSKHRNLHATLLEYLARTAWCRIWEREEASLERLDADGDGEVSVEEIQSALVSVLGFKVSESELTFAREIHSFADRNGDGRLDMADIEAFALVSADLIRRHNRGGAGAVPAPRNNNNNNEPSDDAPGPPLGEEL